MKQKILLKNGVNECCDWNFLFIFAQNKPVGMMAKKQISPLGSQPQAKCLCEGCFSSESIGISQSGNTVFYC